MPPMKTVTLLGLHNLEDVLKSTERPIKIKALNWWQFWGLTEKLEKLGYMKVMSTSTRVLCAGYARLVEAKGDVVVICARDSEAETCWVFAKPPYEIIIEDIVEYCGPDSYKRKRIIKYTSGVKEVLSDVLVK